MASKYKEFLKELQEEYGFGSKGFSESSSPNMTGGFGFGHYLNNGGTHAMNATYGTHNVQSNDFGGPSSDGPVGLSTKANAKATSSPGNRDRSDDGNNGHGNDKDGFDESNPGHKPGGELPSLFTEEADGVNFNNLPDPSLAEDVAANNANDGMHDALAGDDYVELPYSTIIADEIGYDTTITFNGGDGNDTIIGGGHGSSDNRWTQVDDKIDGGAGDDIIWGGEGNDVINGGDGNDIIYSGYDLPNHDWGVTSIYYSQGHDTDYVNGGAGNDYIIGSWGSDELHGGDGNDYIHGGMSIYNASGNDLIFGEAGNDTLHGGYGNNTLDGGSGDDVMYANSGQDTFIGGTGNDKASGGSGNDLFIHNSGDSDGADRYWGGSGYDTLQLNLTQADYDAALGDLAAAQEQFDAGNTAAFFNFSTLGLDVNGIENIDVYVDGQAMDFASDALNIDMF